ncbi:TPA: hypothetical protein ACSP0N_002200, partial [Aeromonas veronii]
MFDKVTQGNEGVTFEQKRLHGKSSRWMNAGYSRATILGSSLRQRKEEEPLAVKKWPIALEVALSQVLMER